MCASRRCARCTPTPSPGSANTRCVSVRSQLGWPVEQIVVIDTDQGQSGASAADREGFQRLVADVGLGKAGIVLGLEVSRLARNNADWHRLLEISALAGTLICDEDGLYDPADFNDRLLLGLKGTMSEAELHFIRARLAGRDPVQGTPRGAADAAPGRAGDRPGRKGRARPRPRRPGRAASPVCRPSQRTGSARAVVYAFHRDGLLFPSRIRKGPRKGELAWNELTHWRVLRTLHNPRYAGAFVYGQRRTRKTPDGRTTTRQLPREQWTTLIPDAHPGYLTWEQFEHNQTLLAANAYAHGTDRTAGPAREGPALLQGLAICGRCGRRMTIRYHQRRDTLVPDYRCANDNIQRNGPVCLHLPGHTIDQAIEQLLLQTVTPLALEVALTVQAELEARAEEADQLRRSHVERARQHAELARRRYLAVDPDNRLVADTLEADWNDALRALQAAQDEYDRQTAAANPALDEHRKTQIRQLATDFPKLWTDPATPARERKRITRLLIEDVTINKTDQIHLHIRFRGGQTTSLTIPIPPNSWQARQTDPDTFKMLDRLLDDHTDAETAAAAQRRRPPHRHRQAIHRTHRRSTSAAPTISPATTNDSAPEACSRSTRPPNDSACTPARSRPGTAPDCSPPTKPTTRTSGSSTRPTPPTHDSTDARAGPCATENPPNHPDEVHYETNALACGSAGSHVATVSP